MGYDMYERHQAVGTLLGADVGGSVLDVGGLSGGLSRFMPGAQVVALNVDGTGDMSYDGGVIPFGDCSFDVVVSLDTLEHVPPCGRGRFIAECMRVARRTLLVAAPYGTHGHSAYEAKLDSLYRDVHGDYHRWLHEHVLNGLPCETDLAHYRQLLSVGGFEAKTYYCGDFEWQCRSLERSLTIRRSLGPLRKLSAAYDLLSLAARWPEPVFAEQAAETANRFYLLAECQAPDISTPT
jgi:hypothetical protein